jgi:hypothetical protein
MPKKRDIFMKEIFKMEWILLAIGLVAGGAGGFFVGKQTAPSEPIIIQQPPPVTGSAAGDKLADIDLVKVPCSTEFITANGDLLCRELFCRMQQRGIDSQTSSADCAAISNINNSLRIIELIEESCKIDTAETDDFNKCALRYTDIIGKGKSGQ